MPIPWLSGDSWPSSEGLKIWTLLIFALSVVKFGKTLHMQEEFSSSERNFIETHCEVIKIVEFGKVLKNQ